MTNVVHIKVLISEKSIRQAMGLAFVVSSNFPTLTRKNEEWFLEFETQPHKEHVSSFQSYLNDYRLRDLIDTKTGQLREKIITRALLNVYGKE